MRERERDLYLANEIRIRCIQKLRRVIKNVKCREEQNDRTETHPPFSKVSVSFANFHPVVNESSRSLE